jgi:hypothetical protein
VAKLILLAIVMFTALFPVALATRKKPERALRTIHILTVLAVVVWAYACRSCYPRYVFIE